MACVMARMKRSSSVGGFSLVAPVVEPEDLFRDVAVKVEGFNGNVGAFQSTLQETPEVLNSPAYEPDREHTHWG
jgi:hypothetical protein